MSKTLSKSQFTTLSRLVLGQNSKSQEKSYFGYMLMPKIKLKLCLSHSLSHKYALDTI